MDNSSAVDAGFVERIAEWPVAAPDGSADAVLRELIELADADPALVDLAARLRDHKVAALLLGTFSGSPYLKGLVLRDLARLATIIERSPEVTFAQWRRDLEVTLGSAETLAEAMKAVRVFKSSVALLAALCDLAGIWPVMTVTKVLTETADATLGGGIRFLFRTAAERGDWLPEDPARAEIGSGYIVLGMGKYGAGELNYSSDIDLIVFYDLERLRLKPGLEPQPFFVRLTRDMVRLMDERTAHGYVFRTDLRLRPDAGATQIAMSTDSALHYYEAFGQNWERAAMIKARAVAGDIEAGDLLLQDLAPFVWRKYLDFAAIADVHAMKRQIHAFRGFGGIAVAGHNVKLGRGGIREIEFFAQTQQLIAGGRQPQLRSRETLVTLAGLVAKDWITDAVATELGAAYRFLRRIEHRLQMVADEQTHEMPETAEALDSFARFAGYATLDQLAAVMVPVLETVQRHYAALFEDMPELTAHSSNMVFAGEDDDPATVETLKKMGFSQPSQVLATVRAWHHGRSRAVRSARSRERLTEVQPLLIQALSETADPDRALSAFDRFVSELPDGVQLFSLLRANPKLLRLVADIMGTAPRLASILSRRRRLLDAVLDPRTFAALPSAAEIDDVLSREIADAADMQEALDRARVVGSEQAFLVGIRVLSGSINANQAGQAYALLAERQIARLQETVERELQKTNGKVPGGAAAVLAMGKLGGREMTASSDLDLIVVYDFDGAAAMSTGLKPLAPSQYFSRLTQRLIAALSAPTAEGTLYEVDMRLRPSGQKGPLATQLTSFVDYQGKDAWTWEHLALTRARVLTGPPEFRARVEAAIRTALLTPRDREKTAADVRDMRARIAAEKGTESIWDLKQVRGGLVDLEFMAQYLQLIHAPAHPGVLDQNTLGAYQKLAAAGLLSPAHADVLIPAVRLVHDLTQIVRLCLDGPFDPAAAPPGLKDLMARAGDAPSFASLETRLEATLDSVAALFPVIVA